MNSSITSLSSMAQKSEKMIVGLMSGTSLDGLDIALCEISGSGKNTQVKLKDFITQSYGAEIKNRLKKI